MSTITVVNKTDETVRIAIYKKPTLQPTLGTIAWKIVEPPPGGGQRVVQIPDDYGVYANYSFDPEEREDPTAGNRTKIISFNEYTAHFVVNNSPASQDRRANVADISQSFTRLVLNEVRIENLFNYGVWGHVTKDGDDIYAPQVIWPRGRLMEDIRASFYLAVVAQFVYKGSRLVEEEISITETELLEGGTATVTGSKWKGYEVV